MFSLSTSTSRYLKGRFGYCILSKLKQRDISYDQIIGYIVSATHTRTHTPDMLIAAYVSIIESHPLSLLHLLPVTNNYKQFVPRSDPTFCRIWFYTSMTDRVQETERVFGLVEVIIPQPAYHVGPRSARPGWVDPPMVLARSRKIKSIIKCGPIHIPVLQT